MKRLILLGLVLMLAFVISGCPKKTPPPPEAPPPVEEPKPQEPTKPEPKPEPEVKKVTESDFRIVYFDFDKYNLVDSAKQALDHNAMILKDNPNLMIRIEGHCDERGTIEYNLSLGEKRAAAAKKYLTDLGIDPGRLQTISYGKERPAVAGSNEAAWAKNRRDEFKIISQ
ncbi:MAG: peptidoglycan-associated lipoprotein Pal [Candidatus Zixiibacteriota bacterium]|jgi:peptidoglycan-associated lipoprotein